MSTRFLFSHINSTLLLHFFMQLLLHYTDLHR
ncbi:hypothetical protein MelnitzEXVC044M_214 [Methylophilales phage Melnitz EXVC044M]|nr:hypothetical protein Melnitz1EXVC043M_213 [Methylophilales phage Melnitz-1 EXVC043M]QZI94718.1 hypothetical protein Melnitz2EXVC040M_214 [Methylophilales phage Melnitz-2 EXVC040M]QZI94940.1 hypothetical protein MelnitzEXVC044M_214 [Methylophilales phage Melnitz EXVC044M]QZI95161.1 hypothetical protein Melnitz3EXVC039M_214 [Methylophilales phage Melnitz-3 EXVC039M]